MQTKPDSGQKQAGLKCLAPKRRTTSPAIGAARPLPGGANRLSSPSIDQPALAEQRNRVLLFVLEGREQGSVFPIREPDTLIGSDGLAPVSLTDDTVSQSHARLTRESDGVYLEDLGSRNGTLVNERRLEGRRRLEDGDRLRFGDSSLVKFSITDEVEERALCTLFEHTLRDPLTRLYNRRYFDGHLDGEFSFAKRQRAPLALLLVDIDLFKRVNDTYGHQVGDAVLKQVATSIREKMRPEDVLVRYGGEEFLVIARNTSFVNAEVLGERLRQVVQALSFEGSGHRFGVTVSVGVTSVGPDAFCASAQELLAAADEALYHAKGAGRNRLSTLRPRGEVL
jgi:diguanylate cyclase (GGDEF)-like protein